MFDYRLKYEEDMKRKEDETAERYRTQMLELKAEHQKLETEKQK